jgi:hypothetical protein
LGITFTVVLPRITPLTDLGRPAVRAYAARSGQSEQEYIQQMGGPLTTQATRSSASACARRRHPGVCGSGLPEFAKRRVGLIATSSTGLASLIDEGGRVRLDLSQLTVIDPTGIEALVRGVIDGRADGGDLVEVDRNVSSPAREMIDLAGIGPVLWPSATLSSDATVSRLAALRKGQEAIRRDCARQRARAAEMRRTTALQRDSLLIDVTSPRIVCQSGARTSARRVS